MNYIALTKGKFAVVDESDYAELSQFKWSYSEGYAQRSWRIGPNKTKTVYMHRVIMNPGSLHVDHINGDGLDNRRINLRMCTHSENKRNQNVLRTSSTGIKGVFRSGRKFMVRIMVDGKRAYLGSFSTKEEAEECCKKHYPRLHGEFSKS